MNRLLFSRCLLVALTLSDAYLGWSQQNIDAPIVTTRTEFQDQQLLLLVDKEGPAPMVFKSRLSSSTGLPAPGTGNVNDFGGVLGMSKPQSSNIVFDFDRRRFSRELQPITPAITVAIYDDVHLSPQILAEAQDEAMRVYQKAGLAISWIECKAGDMEADLRCQDPLSTTRLSLRIVPNASRVGDGVFGVAFLSTEGTGAYTDVFYNSAQELDQEWHVGLARVLGHVMAHELGHLLLGSNAHSRQGIMCPQWHQGELRLASKGSLLFSQEQARFMRERLEH